MADSPQMPPKPTLESLLRLKRHERPPTEFWTKFDRELRERALRELVRPAPAGWRWSRVLLGRAAPWMTAGAAAAIALVMVVQRPAAPAVLPAPTLAAMAAPADAFAAAAPAVEISVSAPTSVAAPVAAPEGRPTYVVAELAEKQAPRGYTRVPATVAFESARESGVRYAAAALNPETAVVQAGGWRY